MGAGDKVGDELLNLGYELDFINPEKMDESILSSYDVILTGVRFFNVNERAPQLTPMLLRFVEQEGNLIVQYNTSYRLKTKSFFPYALKISEIVLHKRMLLLRFFSLIMLYLISLIK